MICGRRLGFSFSPIEHAKAFTSIARTRTSRFWRHCPLTGWMPILNDERGRLAKAKLDRNTSQATIRGGLISNQLHAHSMASHLEGRTMIQQLPPQAGRRRAIPRLLTALATVLLLGVALYFSRDEAVTGRAAGDDKATSNAVAKANAFLETLDAQQREKVLYKYDGAKKPSWSNLPVTMVPRNGLPLADLSKAQRAAALAALAAVLSKQGYQKVIDVMNADDQLVKGKENRMRFGTDHFYLALFGKPSATKPWMVQFGGRHLGLNVTIAGKDAVLTPTHTGAQPVVFTRGGKKVRPLGAENDLAFELVNKLDARQRALAVRGARPRNLALGPGQDDKTVKPEGIKGSALNKEQS